MEDSRKTVRKDGTRKTMRRMGKSQSRANRLPAITGLVPRHEANECRINAVLLTTLEATAEQLYNLSRYLQECYSRQLTSRASG